MINEFMKEEEKWDKEHYILLKFKYAYYWCYRNLNIIDWYREIKWFLQRIFRGYSDRDIWGMNTYLGYHILKCLKAFKKRNKSGYPAGLSEKKWHKIINEMIEGWEYIITETFDTEIFKKYYENKITSEQYDKESKILYNIAEKKAMLFIKYLNNLWD